MQEDKSHQKAGLSRLGEGTTNLSGLSVGRLNARCSPPALFLYLSLKWLLQNEQVFLDVMKNG